MGDELAFERRAEADLSGLDRRIERQVRGKIWDKSPSTDTNPLTTHCQNIYSKYAKSR